MSHAIPDKFGGISARDASRALGVSERTIRRAIARGELAATKHGRAFHIMPEALEVYRTRRGRSGRDRAPTTARREDAPAVSPRLADQPFQTFRPETLPAQLTRFIGREREVAAVSDLLRQEGIRLVTLTGPGGVGKTRLALRAAETVGDAFADGVSFVPLAMVRNREQVLSAIASALAIRELSDRPLAMHLAATLRSRRLLLVLDNFEHLTDAASTLSDLLSACPSLRILVTSRAPLRVSGERRFLTPPLTLPGDEEEPALERLVEYEAIALFVERAQHVRPDFALGAGNATVVIEICRRLDGLPLALELAAVLFRVLSPAALLARMEKRLPLLTGGTPDQPARQRTMRDTIAWSHDLLSESEQRMFRRLGIFVGGFTLDGAERVWNADAEPPDPITGAEFLELLAGLIDKGMVLHIAPDAVQPRFAMLETIREFSLEELTASGETALVETALAAQMLALANEAEPHLIGPDERLWQARLDDELGNLRAVLAWSLTHDVTTALRIGAALWAYWAWRGPLSEGRRWLADALAARNAAPAVVQAKALTTAVALALFQGDTATHAELAPVAVALARETGDRLAEARALWIAGTGPFYAGRPSEAVPYLEQSLEFFEKATTDTDRAFAAYARAYRGIAAMLLGQPEQGIAYFEEALARARDVGTSAMTLMILNEYAGWLIDFEDLSHARAAAMETLPLAARFGERWPAGFGLNQLGIIDAIEGAPVSAARRFGAAEALLSLSGIAKPIHHQSRTDRAVALVEQALGAAEFSAAWAEGHANPASVFAAAMVDQSHAAEESPQAGETGTGGHFRFTAREREVLRLLAVGKSDKEIAAALFVARRTASKHVSAILTKLEVDSRTAAVAMAIRIGLA